MARVTVFMPVYNSEKYLKNTIESILSQTFTDFDFLIINDGSTDKSVEIIESFSDSRIKLLHNEGNLGIVPTRNRAIDLINTEYMVLTDSDDISAPERIQKLVDYMDKNPNIAVCSSWLKYFYTVGENNEESLFKCEENSDLINIKMLFYFPVPHPACIFRTNIIKNYKYDEAFKLGEDYELFSRIIQKHQIAVIQEPLYLYNRNDGSISNTQYETSMQNTEKVIINQLNYLGIEPTDQEIAVHHSITRCQYQNNFEYQIDAENWLLKIIKANEQKNIYNKKILYEYFSSIWFEIVKLNVKKGIKCWNKYNKSELKKYIYKPKNSRKIFFRSLIGSLPCTK